MSLRAIILAVFVLFTPARHVLGQLPSDEPNPNRWPERNSRSNTDKKALARRNVWVFEYRFTSEEKQLLTPSAGDQQRYATFLGLDDTGLIRLYPWIRKRSVVSIQELVDRRSPEFNVHACLYSFSKGKHGNALNGFVDPRLGWAELKLGDGKFFTGFTGESLGVLVALGDTPLETVTPSTEGVRGLTNIIPPADYLEASALSRRNRAGFEMERYRYGSSLPVLAKHDLRFAVDEQ